MESTDKPREKITLSVSASTSGIGLIFTTTDERVCKRVCGNELAFYQRCSSEEKLKPFQKIIPRVLGKFPPFLTLPRQLFPQERLRLACIQGPRIRGDDCQSDGRGNQETGVAGANSQATYLHEGGTLNESSQTVPR